MKKTKIKLYKGPFDGKVVEVKLPIIGNVFFFLNYPYLCLKETKSLIKYDLKEFYDKSKNGKFKKRYELHYKI